MIHQVFLVNNANPTHDRLLVGTQRIFVDTAKPIKSDLNGSVLYKLARKRIIGMLCT